MSLALYLRSGRAQRELSLEDVARTTKIQTKILERLETGAIHLGDGLPAEVFVRGFIRSYAKCCGLDEAETLARYAAAWEARSLSHAPAIVQAPPAARAVVEAMSELAPRTATPVLRPEDALSVDVSFDEPMPEIVPEASVKIEAQPRAASKKKKQRGGKRANRATKRVATGTPSAPMPVVASPVEAPVVDAAPIVESPVDAVVEAAPAAALVVEAAPIVEAAPVEAAPAIETPAIDTDVASTSFAFYASPVDETLTPVDHLDPLVAPPDDNDDIVATPVWTPVMPSAITTASVPWRRGGVTTTIAGASVPTLVIDDNDPESAAQVLEDREAAKGVLTNAQRRSFLPPILLDREDRGARQGGLTLAVIILLIAATLTLSYLMRRPSSSGDGVTSRAIETQPIG